MNHAKRITMILLGCLIAAFSFNIFLIPNEIAAGGFSGLALVISTLIPVPIGTIIIILNIPLFIWGFLKLGKEFVLLSLMALVFYSIVIDLVPVPVVTSDNILCAIYGGVGTGLGFGLILKAGSTSGGVDMLARLMTTKFRSFPIGKMMFMLDFGVILTSILIIGLEPGLYAIIAVFISSKVVDIVIEGTNRSKAFFIITSQPEEITRQIFAKLERGVSEWHGRGVYTDTDKTILLCAVNDRAELMDMKQIIRKADKKAFVLVADMAEVLGEGFYDITQER